MGRYGRAQSGQGRNWRRWWRCSIHVMVGILIGGLLHVSGPRPLMATPPGMIAQVSLEQGQALYQQGRLESAAQVLQQVIDTATDPVTAIVARRNLALVWQQQGEWQAALATIADARSLLATPSLPNPTLLLAQLLDVQGAIQLDQGQGEAAIATWQQAADYYGQLDQPTAVVQAQMRQAQAMQQLGFHRQVVTTLEPIVTALGSQADTVMTAIALQTLGDSLLQTGNLTEAEATLQASLAMAQRLADPLTISAAALSLGNLQRAQGQLDAALRSYEQADQSGARELVRLQARLNQIALFTQTGQIPQVQSRWPDLRDRLNALPASQPVLFAKINLAERLLPLVGQNPTPQQLAALLTTTIQQAQQLGDRRTESFAQGTLGHLYEIQGQWDKALTVSRVALGLAQALEAQDITYRWQWQVGRIYKAQKQSERAIAFYSDAVSTLKQLRTDLVAVNPAVQVSFQENVEPIHRELVSLLLDPNRNATNDDLENARNAIESLQLAELDNFFREACLDGAAVGIDDLDQRAAVLYPVILGDRLELIVSLPNQSLQHYASTVSAADLNELIEQLRYYLALRVGRQYLPFAQQVYDIMIRPAAADLARTDIDTLVFVLDGELRNIPMAALHDGQQFLLEKYSLAVTPGLQLVNPKPIQSESLQVLTAGLSEARQGFSALPNVVEEVEQIKATLPASAVLLNNAFTSMALAQNLAYETTPIVHLASHGKFSSTNEETFVLTWDDRLDIQTLNTILQTSELNQNGPIELLVLSACETATGDKLAALGLAGMAVRSGASSTIATLWQVNDEATALLMTQLYTNLNNKMPKAAALRQAQLKVLNTPRFRQHPFYWAPYVLVGNWL